MIITITPSDRRLMLVWYRRDRRHGVTPLAAAQRLRTDCALTCTDELLAQRHTMARDFATMSRQAGEDVEAILDRFERLPYWRSGKITAPIPAPVDERCTWCGGTEDEHAARLVLHTFRSAL